MKLFNVHSVTGETPEVIPEAIQIQLIQRHRESCRLLWRQH
jgi:hypothetical protein